MEEELFRRVMEYDFSSIEEWIELGNSINICNENGNSLFAEFLNGYYSYGDIPSEEAEQLNSRDQCDYEFWESFVSFRQQTPLESRSSGILDQMNFFFTNGADVNLCKLQPGGMVETPLSIAVCAEDYYITKYLLEHGANPKVRLFDEDTPGNQTEHWLIEHMDVRMMDSKGKQFDNELRIAALLAKHGLDDFGGLCISIDKDTRTIIGHKLKVMY
ncbi:hypothetical protein ACPWSR_00625 [Alloiococcus sp. CFN-8]|uniref:hypothetical protein n=1 Tax=Alloiococcus sp. CFN-8 TaxID=3416081 RepID=UPI003CEC53D0